MTEPTTPAAKVNAAVKAITEILAECQSDIVDLVAQIREALAAPTPPQRPAEPPRGAHCHGGGRDVWTRSEDVNGHSRWWCDGESYTYDGALQARMDPGRRLVELPHFDDGAALVRIDAVTGDGQRVRMPAVRAVLRALAEGNR